MRGWPAAPMDMRCGAATTVWLAAVVQVGAWVGSCACTYADARPAWLFHLTPFSRLSVTRESLSLRPVGLIPARTQRDPCYNPNLHGAEADFTLAWPPAPIRHD
jgi:hypothetical protein